MLLSVVELKLGVYLHVDAWIKSTGQAHPEVNTCRRGNLRKFFEAVDGSSHLFLVTFVQCVDVASESSAQAETFDNIAKDFFEDLDRPLLSLRAFEPIAYARLELRKLPKDLTEERTVHALGGFRQSFVAACIEKERGDSSVLVPFFAVLQ